MGFAASYRYGKADLDPWVKDLTINMVAVEILEMDTKTRSAAGGAENLLVINTEARIRELQSEIRSKLDAESSLVRERKILTI